MPLFKYRARNENGQKTEGLIQAESKMELAHSLKNQGLILVFAESLKEGKGTGGGGIILFKRVSLTEKMMFIKHLSVMIRAGLNLPRAIEILAMQTKSVYFKEVLENIKESLKSGKNLADSMQKYPKIFPPLFSSSVRIGEMGGNLEEVLDLLSIQLQKEHELKTKVRGAMIYPSVIVVAMIIIAILLMIFVVPNLMKIFTEMNIELPLSTKMIIAISGALSSHVFLSLGAIALVPISIIMFRRHPVGKKFFDFMFLKIPAISGIIKKINTARFARTLSSLLKSGVAIVNALDIIGDSLDNVYFKKALKQTSESVQKGTPLNQSLGEYSDLFPPMVIQMIKVGEETGSSEQILAQLADFYEKEVDEITKNLSSVIEPALIMVIGGSVGFFAISIIQPMYMVMDYVE